MCVQPLKRDDVFAYSATIFERHRLSEPLRDVLFLKHMLVQLVGDTAFEIQKENEALLRVFDIGRIPWSSGRRSGSPNGSQSGSKSGIGHARRRERRELTGKCDKRKNVRMHAWQSALWHARR